MLGQVEASEKSDSARKTGSKFTAAFSIRSMSMAALSLLVAVGLATAAAGGTYAYLNDKATLAGGTVTAGTAVLTITSPVPLATDKLFPGKAVSGSVTVTNTGNVPLALNSTLTGSTPLAQALTIGLRTTSTATDCAIAPAAPTWSVGSIAAPGSSALGTLAAGSSITLCVSAALPTTTSAPQGQSASFNIQLDGTQV